MSCGPRLVVQPIQPVRAVVHDDRGTVVVPSDTTGVTHQPVVADRVVVRDPAQQVVLDRRVVEVVEIVERGPQGPRGAPGSSIPVIAFAYGDAPSIIWTADVEGLLDNVRLIIDVPFDGVGAQIVVGTAVAADDALAADMNLPTMPYEYENTPDVHLAAGASVWLTIVPGAGATQGSGRLLIHFLPD